VILHVVQQTLFVSFQLVVPFHLLFSYVRIFVFFFLSIISFCFCFE